MYDSKQMNTLYKERAEKLEDLKVNYKKMIDKSNKAKEENKSTEEKYVSKIELLNIDLNKKIKEVSTITEEYDFIIKTLSESRQEIRDNKHKQANAICEISDLNNEIAKLKKLRDAVKNNFDDESEFMRREIEKLNDERLQVEHKIGSMSIEKERVDKLQSERIQLEEDLKKAKIELKATTKNVTKEINKLDKEKSETIKLKEEQLQESKDLDHERKGLDKERKRLTRYEERLTKLHQSLNQPNNG